MTAPSRPGRRFAPLNVSKLPFVRIYFKREFVRSHRLEQGVYVVGREPTCDIIIPGRYVSRKHFQIEYEEGHRIYAQDLGSSNGILVNGVKVDRVPLAHGDRIQIGDLEFRFSVPVPAQPKVIPFPKIRTDPKIDVAKLRAAPMRSIPVPARPKKSATPNLALPLIVVALSAGLAWSVHYWMVNRTLPGLQKVRAVFAFRPVAPPQIQVANPVRRSVAPSPPPVVAEPETAINPPVAAVPKAAAPSKPETAPVRRERDQITASLEKSLKGLEDGGLGGVDRIATTNQPKSESNLSALKTFKNERATIDVEIQMPKLEEIEKKREAEKAAKKYDPEEYQAMLRSRITGVEACYYEHVKEGAAGKVSVWFSIARSGRVRNSGIAESTLKSAALQECILQKISKLELDPPPFDGFTVTYAFRFGAQKVRF